MSFDDLVVETTFINPYSADSNSWDYGFLLRRESSSAGHIFVVITSDRYWGLGWRRLRNAETQWLDRGIIPTLDTSAKGRNHVKIIAIGDRGWLFVNGEFVSSLDLSVMRKGGEVAIITGYFRGNQVAGAVTGFENFRGDHVTRRYTRSKGETGGNKWIYRDWIHAEVQARDLVAEVEFVNPNGEDWDYGFVIREPETNRHDVIGLHGGGFWFHLTRYPRDAEYTEVWSGWTPDPSASDKNRLLLFAFGDVGWFFMNDRLLGKLDLSYNIDKGRVSVMGDFFPRHRASPEFENFNVWVP